MAIVLECRPNKGSSQQHSLESIVEDFKQFEHCEDHNFHVNIDALHQGLAIFKIERLDIKSFLRVLMQISSEHRNL